MTTTGQVPAHSAAHSKAKARTHKMQTVPVQPLEDFMKQTVKTPEEIAVVVGYSPGAIYYWIRHGKMPRWMLVVLEGLKRRMGPSIRGSHYLTTVPPDKTELFEALCKMQGVKAVKVSFD